MPDDGRLQKDVQDELDWEPGVTAAHIGVTVADGIVTLFGHVTDYAGKLAAETAAGRVKGVRAVAEEIEVRLPFDAATDDATIAAAALHRIAWNVSVPADCVTIKVEQGWVTLTGQVSTWHERDAVEKDIRPLRGVTGLSDQITIKSAVDTGYLSDTITHALGRSWFFDPKEVQVSATDGRVRLTGTVKTCHERALAAVTAWSAPGVSDVQNDISVRTG